MRFSPLSKLRQAMLYGLALLVLASSVAGAVSIFGAEQAAAQSRVELDDFRYQYIVTGRQLHIRAYLPDDCTGDGGVDGPAAIEFSTTDNGVNFGASAADFDCIDGFQDGRGNEVDELNQLFAIFVGERARDGELRGANYPGDIGIDIEHPHRVAAYRLCLNTEGGNLNACVERTEAEIIANGPDGDGGGGDENPTCETHFTNPASWFLCPLFNGLADLSDWFLHNMVEPLLITEPISTSPDDSTFKIWSSFRVYANIFIVLAMLVIIFGQSIGGGLVDAYTVKKSLPRLLVAVILINLSIYIVALAIDIVNVIGGTLGQLIIAPIKDSAQFTFSPSGIQSVGATAAIGAGVIGPILVGAVFAPGVLSSVAGFILLFVILPVVIALIGAFITMVIRKGIILALVIVSPVAFALYALPNTEQYFRKWWSLLITTLMVYPIIILIFAIGDILTVTILEANGMGGQPLLAWSTIPRGTASVLAFLIAFFIQFITLGMIPFGFKVAKGAVSTVYGAITGSGGKLREFAMGNPNDPNSLQNRVKRQAGEAVTRGQARTVHAGRAKYDKDGNLTYDPSRRTRARARFAGLFGNADQRLAGYNKQASQRRDDLTGFGDDALVFAGAGYTVAPGEQRSDRSVNGTDEVEYYDSKGKRIGKQVYDAGKRFYGGSQHDVTQSLGYTDYKAQTDADVENFMFAFQKNAEQGGWNQDETTGNWLGATYPHKGQFASIRYSSPEVQSDGSVQIHRPSENTDKGREAYFGHLKDLHKTRQSFRLNEERDQDWQMMHDRQRYLEDRLLTAGPPQNDDQRKAIERDKRDLAMTYEIFDSATQKLQMVPDPNNPGQQISAAGATPAAQAVIQNAVADRRFELRTADTATQTKELVQSAPQGAPANWQPQVTYGGIKTTGEDIDRW